MPSPTGQQLPATGLVVRNQSQHSLRAARTTPYPPLTRQHSPTTAANTVDQTWPTTPAANGDSLLTTHSFTSDTEDWATASTPAGSGHRPLGSLAMHSMTRAGPVGSTGGYLDDLEPQPLRSYTPPATLSSHHPTSRQAVFDLERTITRCGLQSRRTDIYRFREFPSDSKLDTIFLHLMKLEQMYEGLEEQFDALGARFKNMEALGQHAWQPSKAQVKLLRSLTRHYLVKPLSTYNSIPGLVKAYIQENPAKFRLDVYITDPVVHVTVNAHVADLASQMKSAFRKAVFASCKNGISLESFTRNMLDNYHLPAIPADLPTSILGTFAMMRKIADPLARSKQCSQRGDTGFWRTVEAELDRLYNAPGAGKDRSNDNYWIEWAMGEIADDHARNSNRRTVTGRRSRANVASAEEVSTVLGTHEQGPENLDSGLVSPGSPYLEGVEVPELDDNRDEDANMEDDLPALNTMGDVARTIPIS